MYSSTSSTSSLFGQQLQQQQQQHMMSSSSSSSNNINSSHNTTNTLTPTAYPIVYSTSQEHGGQPYPILHSMNHAQNGPALVIPNLEMAPEAERTTQKLALVALLLIGAAIGVIGFAPIAIPAAIVTYVLVGTAGAVSATALMLFIRTIVYENRVHKTLDEFKQKSTFVPVKNEAVLVDDNFFQACYKGIGNTYADLINWLYQAPLAPKVMEMDLDPDTATKLARNRSIIEVVGKIALLAIAVGGAALVATAVMGLIPFVASPLLINAAVFTGSAIAAVALWLFVEQMIQSSAESRKGYEYYDQYGKHQYTAFAQAHLQDHQSHMMHSMHNDDNNNSHSNHSNYHGKNNNINNNNNNNSNNHYSSIIVSE